MPRALTSCSRARASRCCASWPISWGSGSAWRPRTFRIPPLWTGWWTGGGGRWRADRHPVANAGITKDGLLLRMKDEDWEQVIRVNLESYFRLSRAALRA
jgi:NAD(P)-dependent dehydrogenase (short-subunit alcohol dehydrogenase family)